MGIPLPPSPKKGWGYRTPTILAHVSYYGRTAAWIKMPFGTGVGVGLCHIVLHGDPAPPKVRAQQPPLSVHVCYGQTVAHRSYCWALVFLSFDCYDLTYASDNFVRMLRDRRCETVACLDMAERILVVRINRPLTTPAVYYIDALFMSDGHAAVIRSSVSL